MLKVKKNLLLIFPAVLFLYCNENNSIADSNILSAEKIIILDTLDLNSYGRDYLKVGEQYISGDFLHLKAEYVGGCKNHNIKIYTTSAIIKTNPPQAELFISHNSNGDSCAAVIIKNYVINILELKKMLKSNFNNIDVIILRIYEPNSDVPVMPLLEYQL
jgi:NigD-like C-terminal beta sandwich domain